MEAPPVTEQAQHPPFTGWIRWFVPAVAGTLVADLVSKSVVFSLPGASLPPWLAQHYNPGVAWSMFAGSPWVVTLLTLVLIPVLAVLWWRSYRPLGAWENLAFGLILGGALGNALDRIGARLGLVEGVRDFIVVDLHHVGIPYVWPTFNVADSGITVGFALLLTLAVLKPSPRPRTQPCN